MKATILDKGFATEDELKNIDKETMDRVAQSVQFAEESPWPDPSEAYKDVYMDEDYPYITD